MDGESPNAQDLRVEKLWEKLDTAKEGQLDLKGLKRGLRKIDHPLKNADELLEDVLKTVDTSGDGIIQYAEFHSFVAHTEKELWKLFTNIDRDKNGKIDRKELQAAIERAGLKISKTKFEQFFSEIDTNHDGLITFDEWRNFLLFIPAQSPSLKAVISYYQSSVTVNPEGDVHVSDESVEGLGIKSFFSIFFGSVIVLATATLPAMKTSTPSSFRSPNPTIEQSSDSILASFPWDPGESTVATMEPPLIEEDEDIKMTAVQLLTSLLPEPGYFVAGGIAGAVSRTATAPLDRLKVYLIAQTSVKAKTVQAVKSGAAVEATKIMARPLVDATIALWKMGGIRSLFAGNGLNVVKVMPESAIKFGSYEGTRRIMAKFEGHNDPRALSGVAQFFSAGIGGMISQFAIYPLDTLKFRMQCETVRGGLHGNALILATARKMVSTSGIRSFYRGLNMGLVGMFPYSAIDLTTYEYLKNLITARKAASLNLSPDDPACAPGQFMTGGIGAVSSSFGASAVYPLNLLRTRLQSQGTAIHTPTYTGWRDCMAKTVRGEGWRGLYKGLTPNLLKVVPSMSISYVVYEYSKKVLALR